ncbi:MAG TPA: ABC transporter permease [Xanthobacteraceae bacterium]|jgi:ribose/xylose/arabinose/galactoside ABC-type transport system permease subunit|nr:ABC transporter permease [Xanthobacteraceae bacterium]
MTEIALPAMLRRRLPRVRHVSLAIRLAAAAAIAIYALTTPGFLTPLSFNALLTAISFVGCVAVGMTFITLTGNIMSLALGATVSASALMFLACLSLGILPAFLATVLFGIAITGAQGFLVGHFRANPILVSVAALSLLLGAAAFVTGGHRIYPGGAGLEIFKARVAGIPVNAWCFFITVAAGQFILSWTRIGRLMAMVGSNVRAATAAGISTTAAVTVAYVIAGACAAISGILLAARYGSGDMEVGAGYDYTAIAAVLVGGTGIAGGTGSTVRTLIGVFVIAVIEVVLLLRGYSEQLQYLITGLIVLCVIMLHTLGDRR